MLDTFSNGKPEITTRVSHAAQTAHTQHDGWATHDWPAGASLLVDFGIAASVTRSYSDSRMPDAPLAAMPSV